MVKLPTFDKDGNIDMSPILSPRNFVSFWRELGVNVQEELRKLQKTLRELPATDESEENDNYTPRKLDVLYEMVKEKETTDGKLRTPGYELPLEYCFVYSLYSRYTLHFLHKANASAREQQAFDVEDIEKLLESK
jgi:hypothetical protein